MKSFLKYFVELTGNPFSSSLLKTFAQSSLSRPLVKPFARTYKINLEESEFPVQHYQSLNDFFTRRLGDHARKIDQQPNTLIAPIDGKLSEMGYVDHQQSFLVKGHYYQVDDIFGSAEKAARYKDGFYYIFYLSPSHYHRIHYPIDGRLDSRYAIGGKSYPVNDIGLRYGDRPFATNYRIISELDTTYGKMAIVKVGALNINSISLSHACEQYRKGEEIGFFSFGSTVILFLEDNKAFQNICQPDSEVKVGQIVGKWTL